MDNKSSTGTRPFGLRLRITLVIFVIGALLSTAITYSTYRIMRNNLLQQLRVRVEDLAKIGSLSINTLALSQLVDRMSPDLSSSEINAVEQSYAFRLVSSELNNIRNSDPRLIQFVYTFVPGGHSETARFVVDADVLRLRRLSEEGRSSARRAISGFSSSFDIRNFHGAQEALDEKRPLVEKSFTYDPTFGVRSISSYAPIFNADGTKMLAVLGLDMVDTDLSTTLHASTRLSVIIGSIALLLSLAAAVFFGGIFSAGILELERVVKRFSERDFAVRANVGTNDEIGRLGLSFNAMADTIESSSAENERLLAAYERFVPRDFLRFLEKESVLEVALGDQVQREMTVLFSDIRSFTELSEALTPRENFNFINSYLSRMGPEIRSHHGFIDKYIGDAIMALFPARPDDAVQAAFAMQARLREYNGHRASVGYRAIQIGIGIHTGTLMLGTIGEEQRMDGSVIADAVNLCSRLEALTRVYGSTVLISGPTLSMLRRDGEYQHRFVDRVRVRGRSEAVLIYELFDGDEQDQRILKSLTRESWNRAINLYYDRDFRGSYRILREIRTQNPQDRVVQLYMARCARFIREGIPEDWQGIEIIDLK